ncbi:MULTISPECIES: hypothetical protein [Aphanothece]|uniref:hypothetical protein n=1 Tax=Aphanothece TaxID=1121 RepID=UPI003984FCA4
MPRTLLLTALQLAATSALAATPLAATPLAALAATPLASDGFVPFTPPASAALSGEGSVATGEVETFDPVARAQLLAREMPRDWSGTYQPFDTYQPIPAQLRLARATPMGQMIDLRGELIIGGNVTPVQGNLNAESDQLDLLVLCKCDVGGLELGGSFSGQQGLALSGWNAPRLTSPGGRLDLRPQSATLAPYPAPAAPSSGVPVRGMW